MKRCWLVLLVCLGACGAGQTGNQDPTPPTGDTVQITEKKSGLVIPDKVDDPWEWWNLRAAQPVTLVTSFEFNKKIKTKMRPVRLLGEFCFRRNEGKAAILISIFAKNEKGEKGKLETRALIDDKKYDNFIPGDPPLLERILFEKDEYKETHDVFNTMVLMFGLTTKELDNRFDRQLLSQEGQNWSFRLVPKNDQVKKSMPSITIHMGQASMTSVKFDLNKREWIEFKFTSLTHDADVTDQDLTMDLPEDTVIEEK